MVNPDRLSALDTTFLDLESERGPMHVGALARFEGGPLRRRTGARIVRHVEARIANAPGSPAARVGALRGRAPGVDGRPALQHPLPRALHRSAAPGGPRGGSELTAELMARRLDRERPLWEMHWVDGLDDGRVEVLKVSSLHAWRRGDERGRGDLRPRSRGCGRGGTRVPAAARPGFARWRDALAERAVEPGRFARAASARLASPRALVKTLVDEAAPGCAPGSVKASRPRTCLKRAVGPHRRFATATFPSRARSANVSRARQRRRRDGGGSAEALPAHRGATCLGLELHVAVPEVNVPPEADGRGLGNRVAAMMVRLPVEVADPGAPLRGSGSRPGSASTPTRSSSPR